MLSMTKNYMQKDYDSPEAGSCDYIIIQHSKYSVTFDKEVNIFF